MIRNLNLLSLGGIPLVMEPHGESTLEVFINSCHWRWNVSNQSPKRFPWVLCQ